MLPANGATPNKRRKRGGQPHNHNAVKHGRYAVSFWANVVSDADKRILDAARQMPVDDLSDDIAGCRTALGLIYEYAKDVDPEAIQWLMTGFGKLAALAIAHYRLNDRQGDLLVEGLGSVLAELRRTMGDVTDDDLLLAEEDSA